MDRTQQDPYDYTPSGPEGLQASWDVTRDESGRGVTVLVANWTLRDEGKTVDRGGCRAGVAARPGRWPEEITGCVCVCVSSQAVSVT